MWENACYLLPDERRHEVFETLRQRVGLDVMSLRDAPDEVLLPIAKRGGMRPETRVFRWREIARMTLSQFGGDLDSILGQPYPEAKRALQLFPCIGSLNPKDTAFVRIGALLRLATGVEWPACTLPNRVGQGAEELRGHLSHRPSRTRARVTGGRQTACTSPPPAARTWQSLMQGRQAFVPSVSHRKRVCLCRKQVTTFL